MVKFLKNLRNGPYSNIKWFSPFITDISCLPLFKEAKAEIDKLDKVEGKTLCVVSVENPNIGTEETKEAVSSGSDNSSLLITKCLEKSIDRIREIIESYYSNIKSVKTKYDDDDDENEE